MSRMLPVSLIIVVSLCGCIGNSVGKAEADRLKLGMTTSDVEAVLGKGKALENNEINLLVNESGGPADGDVQRIRLDVSDMKGLRWGNDRKNISVIFQNGRAIRIFDHGI